MTTAAATRPRASDPPTDSGPGTDDGTGTGDVDLDAKPAADDPNIIPVAGGTRRGPRTSDPGSATEEEIYGDIPASIAIARQAATRAVARVRELDPTWQKPEGIYSTFQGERVQLEAVIDAANARYKELTRDAAPDTNPSWGVNRLRKEFYDQGYYFQRPTDSPGRIYENPDTGDQIPIMESSPRH